MRGAWNDWVSIPIASPIPLNVVGTCFWFHLTLELAFVETTSKQSRGDLGRDELSRGDESNEEYDFFETVHIVSNYLKPVVTQLSKEDGRNLLRFRSSYYPISKEDGVLVLHK